MDCLPLLGLALLDLRYLEASSAPSAGRDPPVPAYLIRQATPACLVRSRRASSSCTGLLNPVCPPGLLTPESARLGYHGLRLQLRGRVQRRVLRVRYRASRTGSVGWRGRSVFAFFLSRYRRAQSIPAGGRLLLHSLLGMDHWRVDPSC